MFAEITALIGEVPAGLEPVVYVMCIVVLIWLLSQFFGILWAVLGGLFHVR